jgi:ribosomal protein S18 acetylase RimI-like enzyme
MTGTAIRYRKQRNIPIEGILLLYRANGWSSARKPARLAKALSSSHSLISAWDGSRLVGLGNAISDGNLVVYYSHLLVHPEYQGRGIGTRLMKMLMARYRGFHQQIVVADGRATGFYEKLGFTRAGRTRPMWIYRGEDHG